MRACPEALFKLIRERWSIESWHWIRDTKFHEDRHRYRGNGAGVLATLRTAALNLLRLAGFDSTRDDLHAAMHFITPLLAMRQPQGKQSRNINSALPMEIGLFMAMETGMGIS